MNKLLTSIAALSIASMSFSAVNSEIRVGVVANMAADYGVAEETLKDSGRKTEEHAVLAHSYGSIFAEFSIEQAMGLTLGVEYAAESIDLEQETRSIRAEGGADAGADSGDQLIDASVEDITTIYVALPIGTSGAYVRAGYVMAELQTKETLTTGSTYANVDMEGTTVGAGYMGTIGDRGFYKLEGTYTEYDKMGLNGSQAGSAAGNFNKIDAQISGVAARLAVGVRF
jgi:hypothetical protein